MYYGYYSSYDFNKVLDSKVKKEKKYANKKKIETDKMWREDSYGSKSCVSTTMENILNAYSEYRSCEAW